MISQIPEKYDIGVSDTGYEKGLFWPNGETVDLAWMFQHFGYFKEVLSLRFRS